MLQYEELILEFEGMKPQLTDLKAAINYDGVKKEIADLEEQTAQPDFWNDSENSQKISQKLGALKGKLAQYDKLAENFDDVITMAELANEEEDESMLPEVKELADKTKQMLEEQKLVTLLSGEFDSKNAILTFHAGAGGTEAQDWVEMLYRMYNRWAERHNFKVSLLDYLEGEEAGIKSASILIEGLNAYGFLKSENGVHRLVRVSPFDASGRRHTSFASLEVMPEIDEDTSVDIRPEDIEMEVYRSSGAGGQKVNKTSSAVRLIHKPTGIVCACQTQRSQVQNREYAMRMLISKLVEIKEREHLEKISDIKGEQLQIAWGAQIRSYVFMPYTLAKYHRTGFEMGNIQAVMDGDIDGFINAYLKSKALENNA
ncbi:MAG: peptide chain release factor 2 [Ruminiclostridium sp.]|nr:peptide chain release factor 2 [Ruminiclostridium sp.]